MMGRGAEGGSHQIVSIPSGHGSKVRPPNLGLDIYTQVLKALAVRSPNREDSEQSGGASLPLLAAPLSLKVTTSLDSKRKNRAKKSQPRSRDGGPASKKRHYVDDAGAAVGGDSSIPGQFWAQMDDYFREVTAADIQLLLPSTCPLLGGHSTVSDSCLLIPPFGQHYTEKWAKEDANQVETVMHQIVTRVKRKLLAASPVGKKCKKLSGEVVTTVISPPPEHEDQEELCHVCNGGDSDESNQILFCDICNVAVHQDCYGVRHVPEGQWLCAWCSRKTLRKAEGGTSECVLCPLRGGAVKPVVEVDSKGNLIRKGVKFAHLFCSQWVPETYIGNMEAMEPIRNVEGVRDERWRLLCSVCKEKHGACIQCSHGMCATAFHPLCAREAKLHMEVSSREDSEDVDLRAYCFKHSSARVGKPYVVGSEGTEAGASLIKSGVDDDVNKPCESRGVAADTNLSEGMTNLTKNPNEEQASPGEDLPSSPAIQPQTFNEEKVIVHSLVDSNLAEEEALHAQTSIHQAEGMECASVEPCTTSEAGAVGELKSEVSKSSGEKLELVKAVSQVKQGTDQDNHVAASTTLQSWGLDELSLSDSRTVIRLDGGRTKVAAIGKNSLNKPPQNALLPVLTVVQLPVTSDGSKVQHEGCLVAEEIASAPANWDEKGQMEERRQRGLSWEASTSQSHATSPADSPATAAAEGSSSQSPVKDEKDVLGLSGAGRIGESFKVSMPSVEEEKGAAELGSMVDIVGQSAHNNAEKISRKSLRQSVVRADIGKLSIANGKKAGYWPEKMKGSVAEGGVHAHTSEKMISTVRTGSTNSRIKVAEREDEAEGYRPEGMSLAREAVSNGGGGGAYGVDCKGVSAFQIVTSPDSEEEVQQTTATDLNLQHTQAPVESIEKPPQVYAHPHLLHRLRTYHQKIGDTKLSTDPDSGDQLATRNSTRVEEVGEDEGQKLVANVVPAEQDQGLLEKEWEHLRVAESEGVLQMAPDDEIEGELLVMQDMLLSYAQENQVRCERVLSKLLPYVAEERALLRRRGQDLAIVHKYLSQAREAKKLGRREKRDKEAQAVLAAATAAAAASPRIGYVKRDASSVFDGETSPSSPMQEIMVGPNPGLLPTSLRHPKPPVPKPVKILTTPTSLPLSSRSGAQGRTTFLKPTMVTKLAVPRTGSQRLQAQAEDSVCNICCSGESARHNKIVTCDRCKVAVHQECYGIGRTPVGVWLCQPCTELQRQTQSLRPAEVDVQARLWVQCALCSGRSGAFKHSTDGRWVHVFCAQWMPETVVGKDQTAAIEGMESVLADRYSLLCSICQHQEGACLTCNFGHCHGAFHPLCARESGFYMSVKVTSGGRIQYRAYCDRHSPQQRAKDEQAEQRQRSGFEEMQALRQIRVEFERVRLICERICRRERLKRDVMQSAKDVCLEQLVCTAHSGSSADLEHPQGLGPSWMSNNNRGNSSSLPREVSLATMQQTLLASSQQRDSTTESKPRDEMKEHLKKHKKYKKHGDTKLHREKLMTPTEASMQNMRLPKGYAYVPVDVYVKGTIAAPHSDALEKQQLATSLPSQLHDA